MATRFYLATSQPAVVTVAYDALWASTAAPAAARMMSTVKKATDDALTTTGSYTSTTGQNRLHRQFVSEPMASGIVFDTSTTYKCYVQVLESNANDNIVSRFGLRIVSKDGVTVKSTPLPVADYSTATEWNTSIRNKAFVDGDVGQTTYTTEKGDRLVIEIGHNDASGTTIDGSSRFGHVSAGGDSGEEETGTGTTLAPWFETSATVTFLEYNEEFEVTPDATALDPSNTWATAISGVSASDSGRAPLYGAFSGLFAAAAGTITMRFDFTAVANLYGRFYFQMDTLPPASNQWLVIRSDSTICCDSRVTTGGAIQMRDETQTLVDTSATTYTADVWHRFEFHLTTTRFEGRTFIGDNVHGLRPNELETALGGTTSMTTANNLSIGVGTSATWVLWVKGLKLRTDNWVGPAVNQHKMQSMMGVA